MQNLLATTFTLRIEIGINNPKNKIIKNTALFNLNNE